MDKDVELLNYILKNSQKSLIVIDNLKQKIIDNDLKNVIVTQKTGYDAIVANAVKILNQMGYSEEEINGFIKVANYLTINMNLLKDDSSSSIAKILIEKDNKDIVEMNSKLNSYINMDEKVIKLAKQLLALQENNINDLKNFL